MKKAMILPFLAIGFVGLPGSWTAAEAADKADFALFDGTNALNTDSGAVCGAKRPNKIRRNKSFTYHVSA
ncbi:MAG: hypothetical protein OEM59_21225, partial [Rhodospirillales bacterium]|nr:hypothetical protein [Rhodospirillales bacterium]